MTTDRGTQRRVIALLLLLTALGGLGAITLGAAAEREPVATYVGTTERVEPTRAPAREGYSEPDRSTHDVPPQPPRAELGGAPVVIALILAGLALAALAIWLAARMRMLARPAPVAAATASEDELTAAQARAALAEARAPLARMVDAQDAVIAAWTVLERSLTEAGVARHPSRTTLEYVVEVLATFDLDRSALDDLAGLYRRALFDPAPLTEEERVTAMDRLDRLTARLETAAAPASTRASTGASGSSVAAEDDTTRGTTAAARGAAARGATAAGAETSTARTGTDRRHGADGEASA